MSEEIWKPVPDAAADAEVPERTAYRWVKQKRLTTRTEGGVALVEVGAVKALAAQRAAAKGSATAGTAAGNGGGGGSGSNGARDPGELAAEVFARFEEGEGPIDVVREMQLPPDRVAGLHRSWIALKEVQRSGPSNAERLAAVEQDVKVLREALDQRTSFGSLPGEIGGLQLQVGQIEQRLAAFEQRLAEVERVLVAWLRPR